MTYRTTRRCDRDIVDIYIRGVADFGVDQAERYHDGLVATFRLLADNPRLARRPHLATMIAPCMPAS